MRNKINDKRSFSTLLIGNYIAFTLILAVILILLFAVAFLRITVKIMEIDPSQIFDYTSELSDGKYEEIPINRLLGENGYIVVINQDNTPIYQSNKEILPQHFSSSELSWIPLYTNYSSVENSEFYTSHSKKRILVSVDYTDTNNLIIRKEYVLDESLNILYQSEESNKTFFTPREYALLTDSLNPNFSLTRQPFLTNTNKNYTLLLYRENITNNVITNKIIRILWDTLFAFIFIYCILIGFFIFWLNRKVRKPLKLLYNALISFSKGERQQYLTYKGTREFMDICASFNSMSHQLYNSETKRKKLEQDKQKMLADISHDLKTPITVIQGYAKAINDGIISKDEQPQYLATISTKADALNELINTFYDYSKMEHPDYSLTLEKYDICIFLRDFMADKYNEIDISGFEVDVNIPEEHTFCLVDKIQLKRAFENIISNSIKHNSSGTTIFVDLSIQEKTIEIIFADNGIGVPLGIGQSIFEPFVVGEKSRSKHGSGLGLAVSKRIIESHGGIIKLVEPADFMYSTQFKIILAIQIK